MNYLFSKRRTREIFNFLIWTPQRVIFCDMLTGTKVRWALRRDQRWSLSEKSSYISCQVMSHRYVYDAARKKKERNEICICELDFIPYNKVHWIWTVQDKFAIQEISCIYFAKYRVAKCHRYGRYIYVICMWYICEILKGWCKKWWRPYSFVNWSNFGVISTNFYGVLSW